MSDNNFTFTPAPPIAPTAIADAMQRKTQIESQMQQQQDDRSQRLLQAVMTGQQIASNMMDLAVKKQGLHQAASREAGLQKAQDILNTPMPAAPAPTASSTAIGPSGPTTASSSALPDEGNFSVKPSGGMDFPVQPSQEQTDQYAGAVKDRTARLSAALMQADPKGVTDILAKSMFSKDDPSKKAKMFIDGSGNAMMVTPDADGVFNAPPGFKDASIQRAAAYAAPRAEANKIKESQFNETQWNKVGKAINGLEASSRSAVGMAAVGNQRAARAIALLDNPKMDPVLLKLVQSDLAGIMQGGSPHEVMLRQAGYSNAVTKWANIKQAITANPQSIAVPEVRQQLKETIQGLMAVDNEVLDENAGFAKESFLQAVQSDPARFQRMVGVLKQVKSMGGASGAPAKANRPSLDSFFK